jgi:hypothetical protein
VRPRATLARTVPAPQSRRSCDPLADSKSVSHPPILSTMAAALPITFGLRIERGAGPGAIGRAALQRWFLLFVFAWIVAHASGYWILEYSWLSRSFWRA